MDNTFIAEIIEESLSERELKNMKVKFNKDIIKSLDLVTNKYKD
jgi:hypothetical protein